MESLILKSRRAGGNSGPGVRLARNDHSFPFLGTITAALPDLLGFHNGDQGHSSFPLGLFTRGLGLENNPVHSRRIFHMAV